jgi:hypothetical protein
MLIFIYRKLEPFGIAARWRFVAVTALHNIPAIIFPLLYNIYLFCLVLSDICCPKLSRCRIKTEAPGITKPIGIYFFAVTFFVAFERIVRGNGIAKSRIFAIYIYTEYFLLN